MRMVARVAAFLKTLKHTGLSMPGFSGWQGLLLPESFCVDNSTVATIPERSTAILLLNVMFVVNYFSSLLLLFSSCVSSLQM